MLNQPLPAPARDVAMLLARILLGVVLFAHGWQKLMINGLAATTAQFDKMGIPLAVVSAPFVTAVELVGGALIMLGVLTTAVAALEVIVMVGAVLVHLPKGIFASSGGWELPGVLVVCGVALAATGPGRYSIDHLINRLQALSVEEPPQRPAQSHRAMSGTGTFASAVRQSPTRTPQHLNISVTRASSR